MSMRRDARDARDAIKAWAQEVVKNTLQGIHVKWDDRYRKLLDETASSPPPPSWRIVQIFDALCAYETNQGVQQRLSNALKEITVQANEQRYENVII